MDRNDPIASLLRLTGARPAVPADRAARVRDAVRAEWRAATAGRVRRRVLARRLAALAAVLLAVAGIALLRVRRFGPGPAPEPVGHVEIGSGALRAGATLSTGDLLQTSGTDRLALRLASGHSVRLDQGSRARIVSARDLELLRGGLYVDSGGPASAGGSEAASVTIRTPAGTVQEIGTQFEVRLIEASVRVRVREGRVRLGRPGVPVEVTAGREVVVRADGTASEAPIQDPGSAWTWPGEVVPMMAIDGRTLGEFLGWFARERGLTVRYADGDLAASAPAIRLSGSIDGMTLDEGLASALSVSGLSHRIDGTILLVGPPPGAE